jgi:hypothetical protein
MTGWTHGCWRESAGRNRQLGLAPCHVLDLKTSKCERKHRVEEAPRR